MGWQTLEREIIDYLHAQLTQGGDGGTPIVTLDPNGRYLDENLEETTQPQSGTWIAYYIRHVSAKQVSTPCPTIRERRSGILMVLCHIGADKGEKRLLTLADRVADAFRGKKLSTTELVRFRTPQLGDRRREGAWWRLNVNCEFYSDAFVTV